jgi:large subunit ribosomal protein L9
VEATAGNVKQIERERTVLMNKEAGERATADAQADQMRSLVLNFERKSGEQGALYGSVTSMDIAEALKEKGHEIDRHRLQLREPLKRTGDFVVPLRLHREVTVELQVKVSAEGQVIAGHMTPEQEAELAKKPEDAEGSAES